MVGSVDFDSDRLVSEICQRRTEYQTEAGRTFFISPCAFSVI